MPHRAAKTDETPIDLSGLMAKLSYALAAFTIEFDNAVESRLAHTNTEGPQGQIWSGALAYFPGDVEQPALPGR